MTEFYYMPIPSTIVAIIVLSLVGGLACYHCGLTSAAMTTHEDLRRYYFGVRTPWSAPTCCGNCESVLCNEPGPHIKERLAAAAATAVASPARTTTANATTATTTATITAPAAATTAVPSAEVLPADVTPVMRTTPRGAATQSSVQVEMQPPSIAV